jgi:hypothetical protein
MWAFATRSRPDNCRRFIEAWNNTNASTLVFVRLDECDPYIEDLKNLPWPKTFEIIIGKREGLRAAIQEMYLKYPNEPWYGFLADDLIPRTPLWDIKLIAVAGLKNISYPNDLGKPKKKDLPTHPCVGGDLIRAMGWFGFPATYHFYLDTIFRYIGQNLNNIYRLDNVIVEHMHFGRKKSEIDQIYQQSQERMKTDSLAYDNWIKENGNLFIKDLKLKGY